MAVDEEKLEPGDFPGECGGLGEQQAVFAMVSGAGAFAEEHAGEIVIVAAVGEPECGFPLRAVECFAGAEHGAEGRRVAAGDGCLQAG